MTTIRSIDILNKKLGISKLPFIQRQQQISSYMRTHPDTTYVPKTTISSTSHEALLNMARQNNWKIIYVEDLS